MEKALIFIKIDFNIYNNNLLCLYLLKIVLIYFIIK
jgi:hypothetical protein